MCDKVYVRYKLIVNSCYHIPHYVMIMAMHSEANCRNREVVRDYSVTTQH